MSDSFFDAAAQVLPALLIALAVEFGYLTNLAARRELRPFEHSFLVRRLLGLNRQAAASVSADASKQFDRLSRYFMNLGTVFLLGETSALFALMFDDTPAWLTWVLGIIVLGCFFILSRAAAFVPMIRFITFRADQIVSGTPARPDDK